MNNLTLETARKLLTDRRLLVVAAATGLHYNTLLRIRDGRAKRPSARVLARLAAYFAGQEVSRG